MDDCLFIRYGKEEDLPFIYSTWRNSACFGNQSHIVSLEEFFKNKTEEIKNCLSDATIRVAYWEDVLIGYSVCHEKHLDFLYVKKDFRKQGIGTLLLPKEGVETVTKHLTKIGAYLVKKKGLVIK